jgi:hypothetical protein
MELLMSKMRGFRVALRYSDDFLQSNQCEKRGKEKWKEEEEKNEGGEGRREHAGVKTMP